MAAILGSTLSQELTLNCEFEDYFGDYLCVLFNITVVDPTQTVVFAGEHLENRSNDDVTEVFIYESNTPFVIQEIFSTFPNIIGLDIYLANLQSIEIPDTVSLEWIDIVGNNIRNIANGTFRSQPGLSFLYLTFNQIETIEENAFEGLSQVQYLELVLNDLVDLEPQTFSALTDVRVVDLELNYLARVGDLFSENRNIRNLYLEYNEITEIHPRFVANLRDSLNVLYLNANHCINAGFFDILREEFLWMFMNNALRTCFHNFNGTPADEKNFGTELRGPVRIFDEFGNLIASV